MLLSEINLILLGEGQAITYESWWSNETHP